MEKMKNRREVKIEELGLSKRVYFNLKRNLIDTLSDLEENKHMIRDYYGIGEKSLKEIESKSGVILSSKVSKNEIKDDTPIIRLGLTERVCEILEENGISKVADLKTHQNIREIRNFKGIGKKTLEKISKKIGIDVKFFLDPECLTVSKVELDTKIYNMGFSDHVYYVLKSFGVETKKNILEIYEEIRFDPRLQREDLKEISDKVHEDLEEMYNKKREHAIMERYSNIKSLNFSKKLYEILEKLHIETVWDLRRKKEYLRHYKGISKKDFFEIEEKLSNIF